MPADAFSPDTPLIGTTPLQGFLSSPKTSFPLPAPTASVLLVLAENLALLNPEMEVEDIEEAVAYEFGLGLHEWLPGPTEKSVITAEQAQEVAIWCALYILERSSLTKEEEFQTLLSDPLIAEMVSSIYAVAGGHDWPSPVKVRYHQPIFGLNRPAGKCTFEYDDGTIREEFSPRELEDSPAKGILLQLAATVCDPGWLTEEDLAFLGEGREFPGRCAIASIVTNVCASALPNLLFHITPDSIGRGCTQEMADYIYALDARVRACLAIQVKPELGHIPDCLPADLTEGPSEDSPDISDGL